MIASTSKGKCVNFYGLQCINGQCPFIISTERYDEESLKIACILCHYNLGCEKCYHDHNGECEVYEI